MAVLEHSATSVAPQTALSPGTAPERGIQRKKSVTTPQCLVVSTRPERREMLERAADDAGWDVIVCSDSESGWTAVKRQRFQLALVDFEESSDSELLKELSSEIAGMRDTLLMLCGNEGDALEEIWARQLGAWLYLPGVSEASDVTSLCEQAIPVAEKLTGIPGKVTH
ncbi:MAG: hypothetical protein AAF497_13295 [Planctomycetota bacterium]